ncbi:MAG TPA: asparagine synthase (glutamine-hydrolyzing) [Polyangiaceae bacterium]|jgi:asparagine synthase (glutamine-hydrolysing)|nr:asparagine synthase (glutamine-hydrolyzing) [Polyangiaceae bacterium]
MQLTSVCGISGIVSRGSPTRDALVLTQHELTVRRMNEAIRHRGPDAEGVWYRNGAALGQRRLAIIDLTPDGTQPLLNEDETIGCVVNGEIYNFEELRKDLVARGHVFRSRSDSEVVLHLYEDHGPDCVAMLTGMFALAVWDAPRERLLLARDRAGKKPLFYRRLAGGGIAFASELHALLSALPDLPRTPDLEAIDEYLTLQYVPSPRTAFEGIFKLPAAHLAVLDRRAGDDLVLRRYWTKPGGDELAGSEADLARELRDRLTTAVKRRLVADVPVGAFLSGGLDSSTIVALMAAQSNRPVETFSIGFPHASDSELGWARQVAKRFRTNHHEYVVTPAMTDVLLETVRHHGEPFGDSSAVATYYLAKMTRRHVTVSLSGDGSDETLAGYTRYATAQLAHVHDALPAPLRPAYRAGLRAVVKVAAPHALGFVDHMNDGEAVRYPYIMCQFTSEERASLLGPALRGVTHGAVHARFERVLAESRRASRLGRLIDLDWHTYLPDDINAKVDIAAMAHGLEVRCPFLDIDVVEFAARLPRRMLMQRRGKHLLRAAMRGIVPPAVMSRRKRGFGLPLRRWMKEDLGALTRDVLLDRRARERGLFDPRAVERLIGAMDREHGAPDRVWTLLVLELWLREFIDPAPRVPSPSFAA